MPETSPQTGLDHYMRWTTTHPGDTLGWEIFLDPNVPGLEVQGEGSQETVPTSWSEPVACEDVDPITGTACELSGAHSVHRLVDADGAFEFRWKYRVPFQADGIILDLEDIMFEVP